MLSWQRLCDLTRRTRSPLFFVGDQEHDDPIVILSFETYETLVNQGASLEAGKALRIPVRLEAVSKSAASETKRDLAPDLRHPEMSASISAGSTSATQSVDTASLETPDIMTPPASLVDERTLEERFYFQPPVADEYR